MILRQRNPYGNGFIKEALPLCMVKDVDSREGIVSFYASNFNTIDSDSDYVPKGAFSKTITDWGPSGRGRIAHLLNHNPTTRVGKPMELAEDDFGLLVRSRLSKSDAGRNALIEYEERIINEHSIGFDVIAWKRDEERQATALTEIKLYEVSGVTWGANMFTPTVDVKGLMEDPILLDHMVLQMKAIKRVLSREITDEHALELETQIKQFEQVFAELKSALYAEDGPLNRTPKNVEPPAEETMLHIITSLNKTLAA